MRRFFFGCFSILVNLMWISGTFAVTPETMEEGQPPVLAEETPAEPETEKTVENRPPSEIYVKLLPPVIHPVSTLMAGTGLFQTLSATPGTPWTFGLAFHAEFFRYSDFLVANQNETNSRTAGGLHFHYFFPHNIEVFATLYSVSNINRRDYLSETDEPSTQVAMGDFLFGAKYSHKVMPFLHVGGALAGRLYSGMAQVGPEFSATSMGAHLLATFDARHLESKLPFRSHVNLGFIYDPSVKLLGNVPVSANYTNVEPLYGYMVQSFAMGVSQNRLQFSLGVDLPFHVEGMTVAPIVEYGFRYHLTGANDTLMGWRDRVAVNGNVAADDVFSQNLVFGVRWNIRPHVALSAGVDFAIDYPGFAVAAPLPVYNLFAMLSYHASGATVSEPCVPHRHEVMVEVVREPEVEPTGLIAGVVTDEKGEPVEGATVDYVGTELPRQATDAQGRFTSIPVKPGEYTVRVGRKEFHPQDMQVTVVNTEAPTEIKLQLKIKGPELCSIYVFAKDEAGNPVTGTIRVEGKTMDQKDVKQENPLSEEGKAEVKVFPGAYELTYSNPEYLTQSATVTMPRCDPTPVEMQVSKKPVKSVASINRRQKAINITERVQFKLDSAELLAESLIILAEVASLMIENPEILELEIQGHTDDKGSASHNQQLSQERADAVREYLIKRGVKGDRLVAKGYGQTKPRYGNISRRLREKNRRVEFRILRLKED